MLHKRNSDVRLAENLFMHVFLIFFVICIVIIQFLCVAIYGCQSSGRFEVGA